MHEPGMDGLLVIDKPAGPTSHDVVVRIRRVLGERRVGHTGTLDPAATGVLPLVVGRATRLARFLSASDKTYEAEIRLGAATDTYDAMGAAVASCHTGAWPSRDDVMRALDAFRGQFLQQPPAFSAKKIAGRRSYRIARGVGSETGRSQVGVRSESGRSQPRVSSESARSRPRHPPGLPAPVQVTAHAIDVVAIDADRVRLRIECSAGFYVRSLAHDLGQSLGVGAHLTGLRRIRSGDYSVEEALPLQTAEENRKTAYAALVPIERMLPGLAAIVLTEEDARRAAHGRDVAVSDVARATGAPGTVVRLLDPRGQLLGIGESSQTPGVLHPAVVLR